MDPDGNHQVAMILPLRAHYKSLKMASNSCAKAVGPSHYPDGVPPARARYFNVQLTRLCGLLRHQQRKTVESDLRGARG